MGELKNNQKGFSAVELILVCVALVLIGAVGWMVYKGHHKTTATKSTVSAPSPVLGGPLANPAGNLAGFGTVRPSAINFGGDRTSETHSIKWQSWGNAQARGQGTSWYVPPNAIDVAHGFNAAATVVAFNLSMCHGKPAYNAAEWYFPQYGGKFDPKNYLDTCAGKTVGDGSY